MRRVVVTGLGMVSPLATGVEETWSRLVAGESGAGPITKFDASDMPCRIACEVKRGDGSDGTFNPDQWIDDKDQRRYDNFIMYALAAAKQAVARFRLGAQERRRQIRHRRADRLGHWRPAEHRGNDAAPEREGAAAGQPVLHPGLADQSCLGPVSIAFGCKGPNHAVVTACATGAHAIGDAARLIALGDADVMVAGGTEAAVSRLGIAGFVACKALSTEVQRRAASAPRAPMTATATAS